MCYSAMVQQDAKKLGLRFEARVQLDDYEDYFHRRLTGEKLNLGKAIEYPFTHGPETEQEKKIAELIEQWHSEQVPKIQEELFKQKKRLADAERTLQEKTTKRALNDQRVASKKIEKLKIDIEKHQSREFVANDEKSIFPFSYVSMVTTTDEGERVVRPLRYHLRPSGQPASFDRKYAGCYNARRDNLENPFWRPVFGRRHGLLVVHKFFEHVAAEDYQKNFKLPETIKDKKNVILEFAPERFEEMYVPTIWDINTQKEEPALFSCALITDEPPPEIAATGHNRCPVFLKEENIEAWLNPSQHSLNDLYAILDDKMKPTYQHSLVQAG